LMRSGCVLLEPYYKFRIDIPSSFVGRAMSDLQMRAATFEVEGATDERTVIVGRAPVATLHDYPSELISYTRGEGHISCTSDGYEPCHNQEEVVAAANYDPTADLENTPHSVFCEHGAGFVVPWNEVEDHKHLEVNIPPEEAAANILPAPRKLANKYQLSDDEIEALMLRSFGPIRRKQYGEKRVNAAKEEKKRPHKKPTPQKHMVIVDGYNVIYAWESLREVAEFSLEKARETLMDILSNYVAFTKTELTLVFDAYLVPDGAGSEITHDGYRIVYTKENQTADAYIERMMHELGPNHNIRMVSGDKLLQFSAVHSGILRVTAAEFEAEVTAVGEEIAEFIKKLSQMQ
ncbi:MAG: NYN domain-containing protein, partial [Clostridia bacterium]|nr:NYN domain-containing protein [Clostridia bacterium]